MPAIKIKNDEWVAKATLLHKNEYIYDKTLYTGSNNPVVIKCKIHGYFIQRARTHIAGHGCPECSKIKNGDRHRKDKKSLLLEFRKIHGDAYTYDLSHYVNVDVKIKINCEIHGWFTQTPSNHLRGRGCPNCGFATISEKKRLNLEEFVERSKNVHGDKYSYENVTYSHSGKKVQLICRKHGVFWQTPSNHLMGHGCNICNKNGFDNLGIAFLYLLKSEEADIFKIGITNNLHGRLSQLKRATPYKFTVMNIWKSNGKRVRKIEKMILKSSISAGRSGFDGATEWILIEGDAVSHINKIVAELSHD